MKKVLQGIILIAGLGMLTAANANGDRYQTANVVDVTGNLAPYTGAAWLIRNRNGIEGRIMTKVTTAGDPYTLWVVIFNNPWACDGACDGTDLGNPLVKGSVFNGTGAISSSDGAGGGVINMDFNIKAGSLPKDLFLLTGYTKGLKRANGLRAEIHLVIDKHPPIAPGDSWIVDLTETNFPGAGPATNEVFAVFLPCSQKPASCPASPF